MSTKRWCFTYPFQGLLNLIIPSVAFSLFSSVALDLNNSFIIMRKREENRLCLFHILIFAALRNLKGVEFVQAPICMCVTTQPFIGK